MEQSWGVLGVSWGVLGGLGRLLGRLGRVLARLETVLGRHGSLEAVLGALRPGARTILNAVLGGQNRSGATPADVSELFSGELYEGFEAKKRNTR